MNFDSYFEVGTNHPVCQDYTIGGTLDEYTYIIGSDGCSSSPNSDIGSRLLCHLAKASLFYLHKSGGFVNRFNGCAYVELKEMFKVLMVAELFKIKETLCINSEAFDATLILAIADDKKAVTFLWGDGVVIYKIDERKMVDHFEYTSNAPYYLSYQFDVHRNNKYKEEFKEQLHVKKNRKIIYVDGRVFDNGSSSFGIFNESESIVEVIKPKLLAIASDGLVSFTDNKNNTNCVLSDIVNRCVDYKSLNGSFVQRRMLKMKKENEENGITHFDDVFFTAINFE